MIHPQFFDMFTLFKQTQPVDHRRFQMINHVTITMKMDFEKEHENVSTYIMVQKYLPIEQIYDYFEIEITLAPC